MHVPPVGHFYFLPPSLPLFFAVRVIKTSSLGEIAAGGETGGGGGAVSQKEKTDVVPLRKKEGGRKSMGKNVWCREGLSTAQYATENASQYSFWDKP